MNVFDDYGDRVDGRTGEHRTRTDRTPRRFRNDTWRDVVEGGGGAAIIVAAMLTPFLRSWRSHWGLDVNAAAGVFAGDEFVPHPRWQWTHGIEIDASADATWPWVAQIGAGRAGFYSYQWLENIAGCDVSNADTVHPDWEVRLGGSLRLHPSMPPLAVEHVEAGRCFVGHISPTAGVDVAMDRWANVTWAFFVEPLGTTRCRVISRYRCDTSDDFVTRLQLGSTFMEPIGFAMDRRMLIGIKQRVERAD
jgi:hypothetical protein